jgi:putative PIN family toxin of toxin-antitoxin system
MRVVVDTVIFVRGMINPLSQCGRLVFEYANAYELIVTPDVAFEYLEVLQRPNLVHKFEPGEMHDIRTVLAIIDKATMVVPAQTPDVCRDPGDDKFLAAAVAGGASFIVSEDHDLLVLESYEATQICTAGTFIQLLERRNDEQP